VGTLVGGLYASFIGVGMIIGATAGNILLLLVAVFESVWPHLRMMLISTVGFITGSVIQ
jgi:hypothetical protein